MRARGELVEVSGANPAPGPIADAAAALRSGELVGLSSECGWLLAWRRGAPVEAELELPAEAPRAGVYPDASPLIDGFASALARRLAERLWPGPLMLTLGERRMWVPRPLSTRLALLTAACDTVGLPASLAGRGAARSAQELREVWGGRLALILQESPSLRSGICAPSLATITHDQVILEREGAISREALEDAAARHFVFVCTGNTCRSPVAEELLRRGLARRLQVRPEELRARGFVVASAGVHAAPGAPASQGSILALAERQIDISEHRSQPLALELLRTAERVYGLTPSHAEAIRRAFPDFADRIDVLDPEGIPDPYGGPLEEYRATVEHIHRRVEELIVRILGEEEGRGEEHDG